MLPRTVDFSQRGQRNTEFAFSLFSRFSRLTTKNLPSTNLVGPLPINAIFILCSENCSNLTCYMIKQMASLQFFHFIIHCLYLYINQISFKLSEYHMAHHHRNDWQHEQSGGLAVIFVQNFWWQPRTYSIKNTKLEMYARLITNFGKFLFCFW